MPDDLIPSEEQVNQAKEAIIGIINREKWFYFENEALDHINEQDLVKVWISSSFD